MRRLIRNIERRIESGHRFLCDVWFFWWVMHYDFRLACAKARKTLP